MGNMSGISQQAAAVSWDDNHHLAGLSQMVSYLIVRLEMQYLHIVFHMTVTSAGASHMPGGKKQTAQGTEGKLETRLKNTQLY